MNELKKMFDIHCKALIECPDYKDLAAANKCIKELINQQSLRLEGIETKRRTILEKYGWRWEWDLSEIDYAEGYYGKNKI